MQDHREHVGTLLQLLQASLQPDAPQRAEAESRLHALQKSAPSGIFLAQLLSSLGLSSRLPEADLLVTDVHLRLLSVIWLKHYLKLQWKATSTTLSAQERAELRQTLLHAALVERDVKTARHLALIVAQIARSDFPIHWSSSDLFTPIFQGLLDSSAQPLAPERRQLEVGYCIVKELASRRLLAHRKSFASLSAELLPALLPVWADRAANWSAPLDIQDDSIDVSSKALSKVAKRLSTLLTCTKLVSTLLLYAFRELVPSQGGQLVVSALQQCHDQIQSLLQKRPTLLAELAAEEHEYVAETEVEDLIEGEKEREVVILADKCTSRVAELVGAIQKSYPLEFRSYLPAFLNIFWQILTTAAPSPTPSPGPPSAPKKLQIHTLAFFTNVFNCRLYKQESLRAHDAASVSIKVITAAGDVEVSDEMVQEGITAVSSFLSAPENGCERFETLLQVIVMQYMRLREDEDLSLWAEEPEQYNAVCESLTPADSVRAAAENLFLTLLQHFGDSTVPLLTQMTAAAASYLDAIAATGVSTDDDPRVLDMDAVLLALGLGCYDLHERFDFEPWFRAHLVSILVGSPSSPTNAAPKTTLGGYDGRPVLSYRIVWLVGCWLAQLSSEIRPPLYDALLKTGETAVNLRMNNSADADAALMLRVVGTVEAMLSDWGFDPEAFGPFVPRVLSLLQKLFLLFSHVDSRLKVLSCLETLVTYGGHQILPVVAQVSAPLPSMWASEGEGGDLVRSKVLQLLTRLIQRVKEQDDGDASVKQGLENMSLDVIKVATDVGNPERVHLMDSALELWLESLDIVSSYSEVMHQLYEHALTAVQNDYEHISVVLQITRKYVQLGGHTFWQTYHTSVSNLLAEVEGQVRSDPAKQCAMTVEKILALYPTDQVAEVMRVVHQLIQALAEYANKETTRQSESVIVAYANAVARGLSQHLELVLEQAFQRNQQVLGLVLHCMLKLFFGSATSSLPTVQRKVWAVAMASLLPRLDEYNLRSYIGQVLEASVETLDAEGSVVEQTEEERGVFRAAARHQQQQRERQVPPEEEAVVQLDLKAYVVGSMNEMYGRLGKDTMDAMLQDCENSVLQRLQA